jgi:hypothetical protein
MLVEEIHKIGFQLTSENSYKLIVPICLKLQKNDKQRLAFEYVERSKSRALIGLMAASMSVQPTVPMVEELKILIDRENEHIARLRQIQTRHLQNEKVTLEPGEADRLRKELDSLYDKIAKYDEQYVSLRRPKPLSLTEIKAMV